MKEHWRGQWKDDAHLMDKNQQPSMDEAIRRAKTAAKTADHRAHVIRRNKIYHTDLTIPNHPHARKTRKAAIIAVATGSLMIIFLPDWYFLHSIAFAAMLSLLFIPAPTLVLNKDGSFSFTRMLGWIAVLLLFGTMMTYAAGPAGNLWSWSPWMSQFRHPPQVAHPH